MPASKKTITPKKTTATPAKPPATAAKTARKVAARPAPAPQAAKPVAKPAKLKSEPAPAAGKPAKARRVALVRDGFTMPESDFALIATLKARALAAQREAKKSELLRAGLQALAALDGAALVQALNRLEPVKTGRPKKAH